MSNLFPPKKSILIASLFAIGLFVIGFLTWGKIFIALLPEIDGAYTFTSMSHEFKSTLLIGFTLALIPIASIWIWKVGPIVSVQRRVLCILMMLAGIFISVFLMRELIKFVAVPIDYNVRLQVPIEQVKFDVYALVGLIIGIALAWLLLKEKKIST